MKQLKHSNSTKLVKNDILGVGVTNGTKEEVLEYIVSKLQITGDTLQIVTPNPEIIVYAAKHPRFKTLVNQAQISLPDGVGVLLAGLFLGKPFRERIAGVDFMEALCQESAIRGWKVGLLGAKPGVALTASKRLVEKYPELKISFATHELDQGKYLESSILNREKNYEKTQKHVPDTRYQIPDTTILFVAFGFPKQEEWIAEHLSCEAGSRSARPPVRLAMGVGGAFDYISGNIPRAPFIIRSIGLEWLYRLIRQPWRIKRQLALLEFIWLVIKQLVVSSQ